MHVKTLLVISSWVVLSTMTACTQSRDSSGAKPATGEAAPSSEPTYLFVQNADDVEFGDGSLTLKGVSPTTVYFTDRPNRSAGHGHTVDFIKMWGEGKDSFRADPPNATLSILGGDPQIEDVVVTLTNPRLEGSDLTYDVRTVEGTLPAEGGAAALFIDVLVVRRPVVAPYRRRAVIY